MREETRAVLGFNASRVERDSRPAQGSKRAPWERRRRFLLNPSWQLRVALLPVVVSAGLLVFLNFSMHITRSSTSSRLLEAAPELETMIRSQDMTGSTLAALASVVILAAVFLVAIFESHATAGAAFNLTRHMKALRDGHYDSRVTLRKRDNLQELAGVFNEMSDRLQERTWSDVERLEGLAALAGGVTSESEARALADELRRFAEAKQSLLEARDT